MKNFKESCLLAVIGLIGFILLLGWAGNADYTDQIILSMSQEEYDTIKSQLTQRDGHTPSESDIAQRWAELNR